MVQFSIILRKNLTSILLCFFLFCNSAFASGYSFVFLSHESPPVNARIYADELKNAPILKEYGIKYVIKTMSKGESEKLCPKDLYVVAADGSRLPSCSRPEIQRTIRRLGFDMGAVIHPKITRSYAIMNGNMMVLRGKYRKGVATHELMHLLGFCDEYYCAKSPRVNKIRVIPKKGNNYKAIKAQNLVTLSRSPGIPILSLILPLFIHQVPPKNWAQHPLELSTKILAYTILLSAMRGKVPRLGGGSRGRAPLWKPLVVILRFIPV